MKISRRRIFVLWLLAIVIPTTLASIASMLLSPSDFIYPSGTDLSLITDFKDVLIMMPLGWLLNFILPTGWITLMMLAIALYRRSKWPLYVVICLSLIYGLFWPHWFTGFMGI